MQIIIEGQIYFDELNTQKINTPIGPFASRKLAEDFTKSLIPFYGEFNYAVLENPTKTLTQRPRKSSANSS